MAAGNAGLMASARMVYGDELDVLFGTLIPTPADRIRAVDRRSVIDLGGGTTNYAVYADGIVKHTGVLAVGGDHVSNDLAYGLKVPLGRAEHLKIEERLAAGNPPEVRERAGRAKVRCCGCWQVC